MKLQIAMDMTTKEVFWDVLEKIHDLIDIIELGNIATFTGADFIPIVKEKYPGKEIVWDMKVAFLYTNIPAIDLGADYVSVADNATDQDFIEHLEYCHARGCKVIGDMVTAAGSRGFIRLEKLGVDQISFYPNAFDKYPVGDVKQFEIGKLLVKNTEMAPYGGFTPENVIPVLELKPDVLIVGKAIWDAEDPRAVTLKFRELMEQYS